MDCKLCRRLAGLNDTEYMRSKGLEFWFTLVQEAKKAVTFLKLPHKYKIAIINAEKEK